MCLGIYVGVSVGIYVGVSVGIYVGVSGDLCRCVWGFM